MEILPAVVERPRVEWLLSSENFSVDGTPVEAWAAMMSLKPKESGKDGGRMAGAASPGFRGSEVDRAFASPPLRPHDE